NFADGVGPIFKFKPVSEKMKLEIISKWSELVDAKAVEPSDTDEEHLRELLDFPEKGEPLEQPTELPEPSRSSPRSDDSPPDETILAEEKVRVVSRAALSRATRRVSF